VTALRTKTGFALTPIADDAADRLLARPDNPRLVADSYPGFPCRRCLRDAEIGEAVSLVSYDPFAGTSPYAQAGPIFLHTDGCRRWDGPGHRIPAQLLRRQVSVRAFDGADMMRDARIVAGTCLEATARDLLEDDEVAYLHVHNAAPGCWAVRIDRVGPDASQGPEAQSPVRTISARPRSSRDDLPVWIPNSPASARQPWARRSQ
jgi:hypothetical protein